MGNDAQTRWDEYEKLVLQELQRHSKEVKELNDKYHNLAQEFVLLKQKSGSLTSIMVAAATLAGFLGAVLKSVVF
jgi:hypothetical protein